MISFLRGTIRAKNENTVLLDVGGVGYCVNVASRDSGELPEIGAEAELLTYLQVREDAWTLFGFTTEKERALFMQLISVNGMGPKMALAALGCYTPAQLIQAIVNQDITALCVIPGVGKKIASRVALELKGIVSTDDHEASNNTTANTSVGENTVVKAAKEALLSMGFTQAEAELALKDVPLDGTESAMITHALKKLGS